MRIHDGAKGTRRGDAGQDRAHDRSRDGKNYGIITSKLHRVFAKIERLDSVAGEVQLAKLMAETNLCSVPLKIRERRINEGRAKAFLRDQRTASLAAARERFAQDGARERGRCLRRIGVKRREKERARKALVEGALARDELAEFLVRL